MQYYPVKFRPIPTPRLWGGHAMKSWFGVEHITEPIGEYWLVSGHPSACSVVANGPLAGKTLTELTDSYPEAYLGASPQPRFPLLIKLIEASADLSVQVHPDDDYAAQEGDFGKTEAWYILNAPPQGKVVYGHNFAGREEYFRAVEQGKVKDYLRYEDVREGDLVFVPARTLHALLANTTLIEVQQTSDITYRVYDWDRVDSDGKPRELHVDKAADVLHYGDGTAPSVQCVPLSAEPGVTRELLLECPYFRIERLVVGAGQALSLAPHIGPTLVIGTSGHGQLAWHADGLQGMQAGDAWLIPSKCEGVNVIAEEEMAILRIIY